MTVSNNLSFSESAGLAIIARIRNQDEVFEGRIKKWESTVDIVHVCQ